MTWQLFAEGKTKGIFQLESNLGKSWSKKLAPTNIEELSALIAIIRPGTLKAFVDGKSMTQHYVDRKHGREEVTYLHQALEEILKPTYGILVYQEQSMRIAQKIAGFNLQEADVLRKAIGKKNAALMNEVKKSFIEGAQKVNIVTKEESEQIFGWIEKSSRYAFNKSHSVSYAVCSYWSAYYKAHHTHEFFLSYLYHAIEKQDPQQETYELISEAK
ncbi:DNA polymerase III subunit alpha, partial [bacterium]|nr:DNA polymerase III subunit alpha [bacterium]